MWYHHTDSNISAYLKGINFYLLFRSYIDIIHMYVFFQKKNSLNKLHIQFVKWLRKAVIHWAESHHIISVVKTWTNKLFFSQHRNPKMKLHKTWKCLTVIELAEMGLHGTFGNLHTYLLFRAAQLPRVSGAVSTLAAPKLLPLSHCPARRPRC